MARNGSCHIKMFKSNDGFTSLQSDNGNCNRQSVKDVPTNNKKEVSCEKENVNNNPMPN